MSIVPYSRGLLDLAEDGYGCGPDFGEENLCFKYTKNINIIVSGAGNIEHAPPLSIRSLFVFSWNGEIIAEILFLILGAMHFSAASGMIDTDEVKSLQQNCKRFTTADPHFI